MLINLPRSEALISLHCDPGANAFLAASTATFTSSYKYNNTCIYAVIINVVSF